MLSLLIKIQLNFNKIINTKCWQGCGTKGAHKELMEKLGINCYGNFEDAYIQRPRNFRFISHGNGCLHRTEYMFKSTYNM